MSKINEIMTELNLSENTIPADLREDVDKAIALYKTEMKKIFGDSFNYIAYVDDNTKSVVFKLTSGDIQAWNKVNDDIKIELTLDLMDKKINMPVKHYVIRKSFIRNSSVKFEILTALDSAVEVTKKLINWFASNKIKLESDIA